MFFSKSDAAKVDAAFVGMDEAIKSRISTVLFYRGVPIPDELIERFVVIGEVTTDEKYFGLSMRNCMIGRVEADSPLKGLVQTGDIVININGVPANFDKNSPAPIPSAETPSKKDMLKKKEKIKKKHDKKVKGNKSVSHTPTFPALRTTHSGEIFGKNFNALVEEILRNETRIEIGLIRFRTRIPCQVPRGIQIDEGHVVECAIVYQFKHLKLGLNAQKFGNRIMVAYTNPDTSSHMSLNVGETIHAVNEEQLRSMEELKTKMLDSCTKRSYVKLIVDFPTTDGLKNMIRNQLAQAGKEYELPAYHISNDVKRFAEDGIRALEESMEPSSVFVEDGAAVVTVERPEETKTSIMKKPSSKKGTGKKKFIFSLLAKDKKIPTTPSGSLNFRTSTEEIDVPTEHNSKLFVALPPPKSVLTEQQVPAVPTPPKPT